MTADPAPDLHDAIARSIAQWAAATPPIDASAMDVFGRVHRIFLRYRAQMATVFAEHGINPASFGVLAALYRAGEPYRLTVSSLATETLISSGGMTMRLDRLEAAGLIVRRRDEGDRRVVFAELTPAGLTVARAAAEAHFRNEDRLLRGLDADERIQLAGLLRRLEASVTAAEQS